MGTSRAATFANIFGVIFKRFSLDWLLVLALLQLLGAGLVTMNSFTANNYYFENQLIWAGLAILSFIIFSALDVRFLRGSAVLMSLFIGIVILLLFLFVSGSVSRGAQSWFDLGWFTLQPSEIAKLVLILVLAKYFSRRHVEIAHIRHIIVSGIYAFIIAILVFLQPDFGSAVIIATIWFGMVLVSGISKKHLLLLFLAGAAVFSILWFYLFEDYQRARILTFIHPLTDIRGAGYNAYQSMIAVGSGEFFGKGIGLGSQSKLRFLPEYQTDFIFAAFAEEWGFAGVLILFFLFGVVLWRILKNALYGATNFEVFFGLGLAIFFGSQFFIHVGMNVGLLPVTGITMPFLSYGGSHLVVEFIGLGILMSMRRYSRGINKEDMRKEFLGI